MASNTSLGVWLIDKGVVTSKLHTPFRARALQVPSTPAAAHAANMAAEKTEDDPRTPPREAARRDQVASSGKDSAELDSDQDDDDDDVDEEPKLKYSRLTSNLGPAYRNGDATSTFIVAGDKMVRPQLPGPVPSSKLQAPSYPSSQSIC